VILADTSVWVDHFRHASPALASHLIHGRIACHAFVIGELALGNLSNRSEILTRLSDLPQLPMAGHPEVLELVERRRLMGTGIGWMDAHLLAAVLLAGATLWTLDAALARIARRLRVAAAG
jgi:predicted nucleic acid-binding protein